MSLHGAKPRPPDRLYSRFTFSIGGCGRQHQRLHNLSMSAIGYGNLQLSFLSITDSEVLSVEPPDAIGALGGDAVRFEECDVTDTVVQYFGDVSGNLGNTFGWTQNGSRALRTRFLVADPVPLIPSYSYRDDYQFSWYGSYPQEWGALQRYSHLAESTVEYIRDVQLGSVNLTRTRFRPWLDRGNPIFFSNSTRIPPSIQLYNMQSGGTYSFGSYATECRFDFLWDADILESAVKRSQFRWARNVSEFPVPQSWSLSPPVNPSFWIALDSADNRSGFNQTMEDCVVCLRPAMSAGTVPAQLPTIANGSVVRNTSFFFANVSKCSDLYA
eukprot:TRINITY_DN7115_c0_g1_i1.p1 TRINITY_DN7115_c0_g1~~TRINITY_DN7115_c0_g1_i1.p1  ORF type:complete len:328 (+),score=35.11 TRINITY_DN7115_c0_g1_i1:311-1294(+)